MLCSDCKEEEIRQNNQNLIVIAQARKKKLNKETRSGGRGEIGK